MDFPGFCVSLAFVATFLSAPPSTSSSHYSAPYSAPLSREYFKSSNVDRDWKPMLSTSASASHAQRPPQLPRLPINPPSPTHSAHFHIFQMEEESRRPVRQHAGVPAGIRALATAPDIFQLPRPISAPQQITYFYSPSDQTLYQVTRLSNAGGGGAQEGGAGGGGATFPRPRNNQFSQFAAQRLPSILQTQPRPTAAAAAATTTTAPALFIPHAQPLLPSPNQNQAAPLAEKKRKKYKINFEFELEDPGEDALQTTATGGKETEMGTAGRSSRSHPASVHPHSYSPIEIMPSHLIYSSH